MTHHTPVVRDTTETLGGWLIAQRGRDDAIGQLAAAARLDPAFPIDGDYAAISRRLNTVGAEPEMHEALDQAELDWASY